MYDERIDGFKTLRHMSTLQERLHQAMRTMNLKYGMGYCMVGMVIRWGKWASRQMVVSQSISSPWCYGDIL